MSASTGGGKSSGDTNTFSPYAPILAKFAQQRLAATEPTLNLLAGQTNEALRTGGITDQIPIANRAVDAARQAASMSTQETRDSLAKAGLAGSSFAQEIMANQNAQQNENVASIPTSIASQFIAGAPQLGLDTGGLSGLSNAMAGNTLTNWTQQSQNWNVAGNASGGTAPPPSSTSSSASSPLENLASTWGLS